MRKIVIAAGCLALVVGAFYGGLLAAESRKAAATAATDDAAPFVPPLERLNAERTAATGDTAQVTFHTISEPPATKVFQTQYKGGTQIVFDHHEHAEGYGLACIQCHHVERCSKCHLQGETRNINVSSGKQALHENCLGCHAELGGPSKCDDCHRQ